jgi:nicotinamidase-related amidase
MAKTRYMTPANRESKVQEYLADVHPNGLSRGPAFDMNSSALLVLDMQRYFFEEESHAYLPSSAAILDPVLRLVDRFRQGERPVILTRHIDTTQERSPMSTWWKDLLRESDERSRIVPELADEQAGVIMKSTYDAFYETGLEQKLQWLKVQQVVVCGVQTHLCVETTVRSAFCRGFNVFLPVDGTATLNEDHHLASLRNLSHGFARMVSTRELLEMGR